MSPSLAGVTTEGLHANEIGTALADFLSRIKVDDDSSSSTAIPAETCEAAVASRAEVKPKVLYEIFEDLGEIICDTTSPNKYASAPVHSSDSMQLPRMKKSRPLTESSSETIRLPTVKKAKAATDQTMEVPTSKRGLSNKDTLKKMPREELLVSEAQGDGRDFIDDLFGEL